MVLLQKMLRTTEEPSLAGEVEIAKVEEDEGGVTSMMTPLPERRANNATWPVISSLVELESQHSSLRPHSPWK